MKTTMKVDVETRDMVKAISRERALDDDATIRLGMAALRRDARREQLRRESAAASLNPSDLAKTHRVLRNMEAWGAAWRVFLTGNCGAPLPDNGYGIATFVA